MDQTSRSMTGWLAVAGRVLLAVASGAALALAFPLFDLAPLAFLGFAGLLAALRGVRASLRLILGFLFGLAFFGLLLLWVRRAGLHGYVVLVAAESLFPALFAWAVGPILERRPLRSSIGASALWVLVMEGARTWVPFGGFPWGSIGGPFVGTSLAVVAPLGGGIAVAWLAAYISAVAASARVGELRWSALAALGALVAVGLGLPFLSGISRGEELRVAIVQGNVPLPPAPASPERTAQVLADHVRLTRTIAPGSVDLVVWPEGVVDLEEPPRALATRPHPRSPRLRVGRTRGCSLVSCRTRARGGSSTPRSRSPLPARSPVSTTSSGPFPSASTSQAAESSAS